METATSQHANISQTEVVESTVAEASGESVLPVLRLRLKKPKNERKVSWDQNTVDNENMNRKKSKCCCIYKKPATFGESSSEDDEECENCFGHPEKRRRNRKENTSASDESDSNSPAFPSSPAKKDSGNPEPQTGDPGKPSSPSNKNE